MFRKTMTEKLIKKHMKHWIKNDLPINWKFMEHVYGHNVMTISLYLDKLVKEGKLIRHGMDYYTKNHQGSCSLCKYWEQKTYFKGDCLRRNMIKEEPIPVTAYSHRCDYYQKPKALWK